jgi:poly-beta-1,6-N-acetyl-D-glucosamine synthase
MLTDLLLAVFIISTTIQLLLWLFVFSKLAFFKNNNEAISETQNSKFKTQNLKPVSVIICARNEAANLQDNLSIILQQKYPVFEVIVVDDASTDDSQTVLQAYSNLYNNLKIVRIEHKTIAGKKGALAVGIEVAQYDWLLMTDADCYPLSYEWISGMMSPITDETEIVLGYGPYEKRAGFLNAFIRFETVWTAVQYFSFALIGQPYMGVGRNLLYRKETYKKSNGFVSHQHIASGDDDLFIKNIIFKKNFKIFLSQNAFMYSKPKTQWNAYFTQKKRHLSTATSYKAQHQFMLGMVSLSHFLHFVTAVLLLVLKISTMFVVIGIVVRCVVIWLFYEKILRKLHEDSLVWYVPFLDACYIIFYLIFTPFLTYRTQNWR